MSEAENLHGLLARFETAEALVAAVREASSAGYREVDAHSPFPVPEVWEVLGTHPRGLHAASLAGGLAGGGGMLLVAWGTNAVLYPLNVGGRPLAAWPAFVFPAFEIATLGAVAAVVLALLWTIRLPHYGHPVREDDLVHVGSEDAFFLRIKAADPLFDRERTRAFLATLRPSAIIEVPE